MVLIRLFTLVFPNTKMVHKYLIKILKQAVSKFSIHHRVLVQILPQGTIPKFVLLEQLLILAYSVKYA